MISVDCVPDSALGWSIVAITASAPHAAITAMLVSTGRAIREGAGPCRSCGSRLTTVATAIGASINGRSTAGDEPSNVRLAHCHPNSSPAADDTANAANSSMCEVVGTHSASVANTVNTAADTITNTPVDPDTTAFAPDGRTST